MSVVDLSPQANNDAGVSQYKHSHIAVVANWFQVALKVDLTLVEAHDNLGLRLDEMGQYEEVAVVFRQAAAWCPQILPSGCIDSQEMPGNRGVE